METSQRADRLEFIREFQETVNKTIEQLLNKPARRHTHQKDKPEPNMEQEKHRKTIHKEADMPPQRNINRELSELIL